MRPPPDPRCQLSGGKTPGHQYNATSSNSRAIPRTRKQPNSELQSEHERHLTLMTMVASTTVAEKPVPIFLYGHSMPTPPGTRETGD